MPTKLTLESKEWLEEKGYNSPRGTGGHQLHVNHYYMHYVRIILTIKTHRKHSFKIALITGRLSLSSKLGMRSWPTTASMSAWARFALSGNWSIANMKVWRTARVYNGADETFSRTLFGEYLLQSRSQLGNIIRSVNTTSESVMIHLQILFRKRFSRLLHILGLQRYALHAHLTGMM